MGQINLGKVRGTMIYTGGYVTGSSASGTVFENTGIEKAYEGDLYINTDNSGDYAGCIYECIKPGNALEATWSYKGNIRGPKTATVNSLKSTSTEDALAAYQGNRLFEMMVDAGVFCKNVIVDYDQVAYGLKVRIDNVDSALIIVADGKEYEYTYTASGTAETTKVSIVLGENIGMPQSGGVVSEIRSDNAYIYTYELTGVSAETVYSKNMDLWNSINEALLSHEVTGTVIDGEETLFMGPIHKFVNGIKKAFYPITHAKAVWFDKANKRTVHDEISELNKNFTEFKLYNSTIINITSGIGTYTATRPLFCTITLKPNETNNCGVTVTSKQYGSVIAYLVSENGANLSNSFFLNKEDTITVTANAEFSRIRVVATSFV